jgi:hypothetical protein
MSALGVQVRPELVDRMIDLYCEWRTSCEEVRVRYERFLDALPSDRAVAFAAYMAALDREQSVCESYAEQVRLIESRVSPRAARRPTRSAPEAS